MLADGAVTTVVALGPLLLVLAANTAVCTLTPLTLVLAEAATATIFTLDPLPLALIFFVDTAPRLRHTFATQVAINVGGQTGHLTRFLRHVSREPT